jgi:PAS domain S-box-containing protein
LRGLLQEASALLRADGNPDRSLLDPAPSGRPELHSARGQGYTVQDVRREYRILRTAILAQVPKGHGLSVSASDLLGQIFDAQVACATQALLCSAAAGQPALLTAPPDGSAQAEHEAVRLQRVNFASLFRQSPEMVCILSGPQHRFEFVNEAHVKVLGFDATGKTVREAQPESVEIHHILDNVYKTGKTAELHEIPVTVTDRLRYFNLTYAARRDAGGTVDGIMVLGTEVTEQVLFRQSNQLQQKALELALENAPLPQVLAVLAQMVELQSGSDLLASILLSDEQGRQLQSGAAPSLPPALTDAIHGRDLQALVGPWSAQGHAAAATMVADIEQDPRWADLKELALACGVRSCWSAPILTAQGRLLGTFTLYFRTCRQPTQREQQIVAIAARTTALILGRRREISQRLAHAEALRESEAELKFTVGIAKLGTWKIDFTKGGRVELSPETAAMFGLAPQYPDPQTAIEQCLLPEDRERAARVLSDALATGSPYRDEYRVRWPSGELRWLDSRGRARHDAAGKLTMLSGLVIDITEQKLAAEKLYASKRMLELAASGGRVGLWHVDTVRGTFDPDEQMAADWGIDLAQFSRTFDAGMQIVHPEDRWIIVSGMAGALAGTEVYDKEFRIVRPSGEVRWVQSKGEFHADDSGNKTLFSGVSIDITDKKRGLIAQQRIADAIAAEREKLEQVLEQSTVPTALLEGPSHVFSFSNSAYLQTFDLDGDIKGKTVGEVFPEAVEQGFGKLLDDVFTTGKTYEAKEILFEWQSTSGTAHSRFLDLTYVAKRSAADHIEGVLATIVDVTDRVRLRQATEKANTLLQAERFNLNEIVQSSPAAMATWMGPRFVFDRVNLEYSKIFGGRPLVGRELLEACPELRGQGFEKLLSRVLETGEPYVGHEVLAKIAQYPGGPTEDRYFNFKYVRINDQDGNPYGVYDFALDVTDRVLAQRQLEESTAKLRQAEDLLKRAIEVANIGFYEWDIPTNRITFSEQMQKDWGIAAGSSLEAVVSHIHPDDRERVNRAIARTVGQGVKYQEEYRVLRPTDGKTVWIEAQGGLVEDNRGQLTRFIGTSLDITMRKLTEEQLKMTSIEASNANSAKSAFLANMSHEIRTPLGAIVGFAELLKKPDLTRANIASFVSVIERNSQHLLRIVDDILDLSKVEAGKMVFEHIEFSLPGLLADFASLMGLRARDKGIDLTLKLTSRIPTLVISDPTRLRQILNNIVGNAIKFTERGLVELSVSYEDKYLRIQVKDTGRGISQDQVSRLFQAFVQADESTTRRFGGTGLGLVLTKRLASAMGGDFYLQESTPDVGSVFVAYVKIGLVAGSRFIDNETLRFSTFEEELDAPQLRMLSGMRILVVDDSPDNRTLLQVMLQDGGASVDCAKDGVQGVERALTAAYDAVLMDIQMPRMDGYQAMELLKNKGYATPVVALTAHAMVEERERAKGKGFAAFMTKPIQRDSLLNLLDGLRPERRPLAPADTPQRQDGAHDRPPARSVLLVEDDVDASEALDLILSGLGLHVRCARTGKEVMEVIAKGYVPSLVLLDLTLPDMPGSEVLDAIRSAPGCELTRVIVVSGWDDLESRAREIGANGSLRKPVNFRELKELMSRV